MSQFVELATRFEEQQLSVVKQGQDAFLKLVETVTANVPAVPEVEVPEQVREALKPAYEFFGSPEELQAYFVETVRTWTKIGQDFQNAVVAQLTRAS